MLISIAAAEDKPAAVTPPSDPTEISLDKLMVMEIPTVEAASKYKQKTTEAPASVTIITADEVKKFGHRTLADILASAPGLYVTYDRNYSFLGVRGFNVGGANNRVLVLVDGHRINNSMSDSAFLGTEFLLDADLIDRVEIIRGPGSSLYGNNAMFGVINVITRKGRDFEGLGGELSGGAGSLDTYQGRVSYGHRFTNGLELALSGTFYDSRGNDELYYPVFDQRIFPADPTAKNNGVAVDADRDQAKNFFGSLAFQDFSLEGAFNSREKWNPTAPLLTDFNDNRYRTKDERGYGNLKYAHEFAEAVDVTAQVYYDRTDNTIGEPYSGTLYKDIENGEWWGADVQLTKRLWDRHTLTVGGEYRDDFRQDRSYINADTGAVFQEVHRSRQNYGAYLLGDFAIVTNLHLNAGFRFDQYADFNPAFNPRLALIYNPVGQTVFKAMYGTAFRAPSFDELRTSAFQNIIPETVTTYELVYEQGIGDHLRTSVAGFYNQMENLILFNSAAGHQRYENLSSADAKGVELSVDAFWTGGVRGRASYTFQQTKNDSSGQQFPDSPQHLAKLNLSVPVWKDKVFAGLEFQMVSRRTTRQLDVTGAEQAGADAPAYGIVSLTLFSQNLVKGLDFSASVDNLLDRKYSDPSTPFHRQDMIEQDGRTFRVKLTYRF